MEDIRGIETPDAPTQRLQEDGAPSINPTLKKRVRKIVDSSAPEDVVSALRDLYARCALCRILSLELKSRSTCTNKNAIGMVVFAAPQYTPKTRSTPDGIFEINLSVEFYHRQTPFWLASRE